MPPADNPATSAEETRRLQATFQDRPLSAHGAQWDSLWTASYTPWDRGGPSAALDDLLAERGSDLFFQGAGEEKTTEKKRRRARALVPGCGRGYDALLLAAYGFDVVGLDYSAAATREAAGVEASVGAEEAYRPRGEEGEKGTVTWLTGDFFGDEFLGKAGTESFDLIFDYTFLCALPLEARPKWAKRMSQLLARDGGRLVCLEWPLHKPASSGGPPWGLTAEVYVAHLSRPGEEVPYGQDGRPVEDDAGQPAADGLKRLVRVQPRRTHRAGYDREGNIIDFISVWSH